jgi:hypothetical protein
MATVLDPSKINELLKKDAFFEARKEHRYLHTHPEDMTTMRDAVTNGEEMVWFVRRQRMYTITYETNDVGEFVANFQPVKGFVPCGRYVISKLMSDEDGYV